MYVFWDCNIVREEEEGEGEEEIGKEELYQGPREEG